MMKQEHKFVSVNDVRIHYVEAGSKKSAQGATSTLLFLHGFPEFWGTWKEQIRFFSANYRVLAPDLPGYNLSDKPSSLSFFEVPNLIHFIAKFIQTVCPNEKIHLVAHDWGGAIAWPLAAFFPQLIDKLIILNAAHPSTFTREMINNPIQRQKSEYIHELITDNAIDKLSKNNCEYLSNKIFSNIKPSAISEEKKWIYQQVWSQPNAINGMLQYYRAMPQLAPSIKNKSEQTGPITDTAKMKIPNIRINQPTLILWGEQDQAFVKENLDEIEQYVPNCLVKRFPKASHWLQHEISPEINREISKFIT